MPPAATRGDGHQWLTQANETDYCMWPGYLGRSYPFDGTDPIAYSASGFLWDAALRAKKTVRIFGEYAGQSRAREAGSREDAGDVEERRRFHGALEYGARRSRR